MLPNRGVGAKEYRRGSKDLGRCMSFWIISGILV